MELEFIQFGIADAYKYYCGIYQIRSISNGKYYIGSAKNFYNRWHTHSHHMRENTHFNDHLLAHKNKYGINDFVIEILEIISKEENLIKREQWWLDNTPCCNREFGFNKCPTAQSQLGREMPDIHRKKVGNRSVKNQYRKGFKVSDETKINIAKTQGVPLVQYTLEGKLVKVFEVPWFAEKEGFSRGAILNVVKGACKKSQGYFWKNLYEGEEAKDLEPSEIGKPSFRKKNKKITLLGENGEIIGEWKNARLAAKDTNVPVHRILKMCSGKLDSFYGKRFRYKITFDAPKNSNNPN